MFKKLFGRAGRKTSVQAKARGAAATACRMESLEERQLLSASPHVKNTFADNRGQVVIRFDQEMDRSTINANSVKMYLTTSNGNEITTSLKLSVNKAGTQLTVRPLNELKANREYKLKLVANRIRSAKGGRLDGEFVSFAKLSGDGVAGGDYFFSARPYTDKFIARYTTSLGIIDINLLAAQAPITVANFLKYANSGAWDRTIFHRSLPGFIIQGGHITFENGSFGEITDDFGKIVNEFHTNPSNIRGTIAMAKLPGDPDSASREWFFNFADNRANLDNQNEGFTVFGQICTTSGFRTLDRLEAAPVDNRFPQISEAVPYYVNSSNVASPIYVLRIAIRMAIKRA